MLHIPKMNRWILITFVTFLRGSFVIWVSSEAWEMWTVAKLTTSLTDGNFWTTGSSETLYTSFESPNQCLIGFRKNKGVAVLLFCARSFWKMQFYTIKGPRVYIFFHDCRESENRKWPFMRIKWTTGHKGPELLLAGCCFVLSANCYSLLSCLVKSFFKSETLTT